MRLPGFVRELIPIEMRLRVREAIWGGVYPSAFDEYKCIFVHVPKTAGISVSEAMFGGQVGHLRLRDYEAADAIKFDKYFKFAFVRNPWDRLFSAYTFLRQGGAHQDDRNWAINNIINFNSFERFVCEWLNIENAYSWVHFVPQFVFLTGSNNKIALDFIGRYESLHADFFLLSDKLGLNAKLAHQNKSTSMNYVDAYTDEMIEIVRYVYSEDILALGYEFEC